MTYMDRVLPEQVVDSDTYFRFVCQTVGSPWSIKDSVVMRKKVKGFFAAYPNCGFGTLVRLAQWARAKKKRPAHAYFVVDMARYAWADGALPEMDPSNVDLTIERQIRQALDVESDPEWRRRLITAEGEGRKAVYQLWKKNHPMSSSSL